MVITIEEKQKLQKEQFNYIVTEFLEETEHGRIIKALDYNGYNSIYDVVSLIYGIEQMLKFKNNIGEMDELNEKEFSGLCSFIIYFRLCYKEGFRFKTINDLKQLDYNDYKKFCNLYNDLTMSETLLYKPSFKPPITSIFNDINEESEKNYDSMEEETKSVLSSKILKNESTNKLNLGAITDEN